MVTIALAAGAALLLGILSGFFLGRGTRDNTAVAQRDAEISQLKPLAEQVPGLRDKLAAESARLEVTQSQLTELEPLRARASQAEAGAAALNAKLEAERVGFVEQTASLTALRKDMEEKFQLLAGQALQANAEEFMRNANQIFENQKNLTKTEIDKRTEDISKLVTPLSKTLADYDVALRDLEAKRIADTGGVRALLDDMKVQHAQGISVTANLANALRASPKTRGRWGEESLRRVMELSGMVERCDFETEKFFPGDANLRPDAVISLSGGRAIVVDAKAPVSAYLDSISAATEDERELLLKQHARQLRERLMNLSQKSYWERIGGTTDCVVMFVPGDNFVSAAFERDPDLFQDGINARVLICTPTTFIALAKAISYGWNQEKLAQNAAEVGRMGKDLYGRLSTMGDHIVALGKNLGGAVEKYNKMVGSLETKVMPQARKFQELGVEGVADPLPELASVDTVVKFPQGGRDLLISGSET